MKYILMSILYLDHGFCTWEFILGKVQNFIAFFLSLYAGVWFQAES